MIKVLEVVECMEDNKIIELDDIIKDESKAIKWIEYYKKSLKSHHNLEAIIVLDSYFDEFYKYYKTYYDYLENLKYIDLTRLEAKKQLEVLISKYENPQQFNEYINNIKSIQDKNNPLYKFLIGISNESLNNIKFILSQNKEIKLDDICIMAIYKDDIRFYDDKSQDIVFEKEQKYMKIIVH